MSIAGPQAAEPGTPNRYQYSLRTVFVLTTAAAVFFSVARSLGYADATVALAAILVVVGITRYPRRVQRSTLVVVTIIAGTLLWLNLRPTAWLKVFDELPPDYLDPISAAMFYRGWPVGPWMICEHQNLSVRHGGQGAIVFDGLFYATAIFVVKCLCEPSLRRRSWISRIACAILLLSMFAWGIAINVGIAAQMHI